MSDKKNIVLDGWQNFLTGLGLKSKDKGANSFAFQDNLSREALEGYFDGDDVSERLCTELPEDGTREWIEFKGENAEKVEEFTEAVEMKERFRKAWIWARMYGGAGIYMSVDDGQSPEMPLDLNKCRKIKTLTVLGKDELLVDTDKLETDINSVNFGMPNAYRISSQFGGEIVHSTVHASRIIRFDGMELSRNGYIRNNYWGGSILERVHNQIRDYNNAHNSVAQSLIDFSVAVIKMKNLSSAIQAGNEELVLKRVDIANMTKATGRMILLDSENESLEYLTRQLSGVHELVGKVEDRLAVASKMPKTKILGVSPGGLGSNGSSEDRTWYDYVARQQEMSLRKPIDQFMNVVYACSQGPTKGKTDTGDTWTFRNLWQASDSQQVDINTKQATADGIYIDRGVVSPEEIRKNRFMGNEYSIKTHVEEESIDDLGLPPLPEKKKPSDKPSDKPEEADKEANKQLKEEE